MSGNRGNFSFSMRRPGQLSTSFAGRQQQQQQQHKSFSMNAVPPPPVLCGRGTGFPPRSFQQHQQQPGGGGPGVVSKHGYHTMDAIAAYSNPSSQYALGKRRGRTEDDYFDDDDEQAPQLEYIPAPGSPSAGGSQGKKRGNKSDDDDDDGEDDDDPLDAFMAGIQAQVERESKNIPQPNVDPKKGVRGDIDDEDDEESYYRISGSSATIYAYLGEFHNRRDVSRAIMGASFVFGGGCLLLPGIAFAVINQEWSLVIPLISVIYRPWRLFLVVCGLPGLISAFALLKFPESPKFVFNQGNTQQTIETIQWMHRLNRGKKQAPLRIQTLLGETEAQQAKDRRNALNNTKGFSALMKLIWMQTAPLFMSPYLRKTVIVCVLQFGTYFSTHGFYFLFPGILNQLVEARNAGLNEITLCEVVYAGVNSTAAHEDRAEECIQTLEVNTYGFSFILEVIYALGFAVIGMIINTVGRLSIMVFVFASCGISGILMVVVDIPLLNIWLYMILLMVGFSASVVSMVTVDLFPTNLSYMEENPNAGLQEGEGSDAELEYDQDGNPIPPPKKRDIDPLPPIYHSEIEYEKFEKNFYIPHEDIIGLAQHVVNDLRIKLGVKVSGPMPPAPVTSFAHFGFDESLMKAIRKSEYTQPTPIQAQAVPAALGGRDIIGIAKTGSGKTAAFLWPMLVHIMDQKELGPGDGPLGLILAPTRELSLQIYQEAKKFGKIYNISVCCCYGGGSKWEQSKALEQGAEIVVATPGRMIDMVKMKATNLRRVTYLVLDEADKMFNMGFEPQVRSICNHVRPDRQTLLFSATFKKRIERLARDVLTDPVRIIHGDLGEANADITQHVIVFSNPAHKWNWLLAKMVQLLSEGSVLVFVTKKADAEQVANNLRLKEYDPVLLHGDMDQSDRNSVITRFKRRDVDIMVATDVAARGLDIPHIRNVVNYDIARDIDTHTHRIGRTGRAGEKGTAFTLVIDKDKEFAGHLVRNLEGASQEVPDELMRLALQSSWFRNSRFKQNNKGKNLNVGGAGLGFRCRLVPSGPLKLTDGTSSSAAGGSGIAGKGPATDRFSAMRDTFRAQYNAQFKASSDRTWENTLPEGGVFAKPPSLPGFVPSSSSSGSSQSLYQDEQCEYQPDEDDKPRKKKSRWN